MRPESLSEKVAHVPDDDEDEVAAISAMFLVYTTRLDSPHVRGEQDKVRRPRLLFRVDRLIRVPL